MTKQTNLPPGLSPATRGICRCGCRRRLRPGQAACASARRRLRGYAHVSRVTMRRAIEIPEPDR